jgi:translocation and assembly module TamA
MSTLQKNHRARLPALTFFTLVALFAASANGGVQVEVRGVEENIRANVLAYLSFERYKNSDDLSPEFIERLQERSEREVRLAMRPFGYYEPTVASEVRAKAAAASRTTASPSRWSRKPVVKKCQREGHWSRR